MIVAAGISERSPDAVLAHHLIAQQAKLLVSSEAKLGTAMREFNRVLLHMDRRRNESWLVVSCFLAWIDRTTRRLRYVSAGNCAALVVRSDGREETLAATGVALGTSDEATYRDEAVDLAPDDVLVLATAALVPAATGDERADHPDIERLASFANAALETAGEAASELLAQAQGAASGPADADAAVLVARFT